MHYVSVHCPWNHHSAAMEKRLVEIIGTKRPCERAYGPGYTRMTWQFVTPTQAFAAYEKLSPIRSIRELMMWKGNSIESAVKAG